MARSCHGSTHRKRPAPDEPARAAVGLVRLIGRWFAAPSDGIVRVTWRRAVPVPGGQRPVGAGSVKIAMRTNCELRPARRAVTVLCDICGVGMMSGAARLTRGAGTGGRPTSVTTAGWARGWLTRPRPLIWKPERTTALAGAVASGQTVGRSLTTAAQAKPGRRKSGALTRRPVSPGWASPLLPLAGRAGHGLAGPPPAPAARPGRPKRLSANLRRRQPTQTPRRVPPGGASLVLSRRLLLFGWFLLSGTIG